MTCTITIFKGLMQCKKSTLIKAICSSLSRHLSLQGLVEETSVYLQTLKRNTFPLIFTWIFYTIFM